MRERQPEQGQWPTVLALLDMKQTRRAEGVVGICNPAALERLVTAVLSEMHDEWIAFPRRYLSEASMTAIYAAEHADHTTHALPNTPNTTDD